MPGCRAIKKYPLAWWLNDHQGWGSCKQRDRVVEGELLPFAALCTHQKFYDQFVVTNCYPGSSYLTANKPRCSAPTCLFARLYILAKNALSVPWKSAPLRKYCCATLAHVFLRMYMYGWRSENGFEDFSTLQFIIVVFLLFVLLFRIFPLSRILEYSNVRFIPLCTYLELAFWKFKLSKSITTNRSK